MFYIEKAFKYSIKYNNNKESENVQISIEF